MYQKIATTLMLAFATNLIGIVVSLITINPVQAGERVFYCDSGYDKVTDKKLPTTYTFYEGEKRSLIRWTKHLGNYTPQERCDVISPRFQEAYRKDGLSIITNGYMNNQPVICTANENGGDCVTLLMTLRPTDNSLVILNELKDALLGRSIGPVRHSGSNKPPQVYYQIDIEEALKNAPIEDE